MAMEGDYGGLPPSNETVIYAVSDAPSFDIVFESVSAALFWALLIGHGGVGLYHFISGQAHRLQRWPLYFMMLAYVIFTCVCESIALGYTVAARSGHASNSTYLAYIFFWHASSASFLVLLLALSSGYCITRGDLDGHKAKVLVIPAIVFIAGVASDYTFVYVESTQQLSAAADRYDIVQMTAWESAVWFIGSLSNIMCFILAWIYIFDSTQLEIKALDDEQQALSGRQPPEHGTDEDDEEDEAAARRRRDKAEVDTDDEETDGNARANGHRSGTANGRAPRSLATTSQRVGLLYGMEESNGRRSTGGHDEESGGKETVADHIEFTLRKKLLSRFYFGVCGYLVVSIMVVILPAFFNSELQNVIVVLQFVVKFIFTLLLAWIFRPAKDSPYLQVGFNESDADDRGVSALDTELTVTDHQGTGHSSGGGAAPAQAAASNTYRTAVTGAGSARAVHAPQLPISTPAAGAASVPRAKAPYASVARGNSASSQGQGQKARFTLDEDE